MSRRIKIRTLILISGHRIRCHVVTSLTFFLLSCTSIIGDESSNHLTLKERLQASMQDVVFEGHFTLQGKDDLYPEYYEIDEISNVPGTDYWVIHSRIKYGEHDLTVPVPVRILWAGDTPVITLNGVTIPGLGTFTARVLLYRGQYVGTWSSGEHTGQQFGRILRSGDF